MTRVNIELDSFNVKFKTLLHAGKDATLSMKSKAGKAFVTLSLDLKLVSLPDLIYTPVDQEIVLQDNGAVRDGQLLVLNKYVEPE